MEQPIDKLVGRRIRQRRWLAGLSQQALAEQIGVKFQQVQKYETGANRVSASRLWMIADVLGVQIPYFFGDEEATDVGSIDAIPDGLTKDAYQLLNIFYGLDDQRREALMRLTKAMAG